MHQMLQRTQTDAEAEGEALPMIYWKGRGSRGGAGVKPGPGYRSSTISLPRIMFIPQVQVNSPGSCGVNSIGVVR